MEDINLNELFKEGDVTLLKGILIDPYLKSITEVEVGPYPAWKKLIECDMISAVTLDRTYDDFTETLWIDDEGLLNEKKNGPYFSISSYPQPLAGKGIILATDQEGETVSTSLTVEAAEHFIAWRPNVKFVGMKTIKPHMEKHPILGDVNVVGVQAQFEPTDGDDK